MMPFAAVLRVVKVFPQVQVTSVTRYSGWMSFFMGFLSGRRVPGRASTRRQRGEPEPRGDSATPLNAPGNRDIPVTPGVHAGRGAEPGPGPWCRRPVSHRYRVSTRSHDLAGSVVRSLDLRGPTPHPRS